MKPPPRPWPIHPKFRRPGIVKTLAMVALGTAAIVLCFMLFWREARSISKERQLWEAGSEPRSWKIKVEQKSKKFIFYSYVLTADWIDGKGKPHTNRQEYSTVFKKIEDDTPKDPFASLRAKGLIEVDADVPTEEWGKRAAPKKEPSPIRYDDEDFSHVAWKPAVDGASGRWMSSIGTLIIGLVVGGLFYAMIIHAKRRYPVILKGALTGKPVSVKILNVKQTTHKFMVTGKDYQLEHPVTGKPFTGHFSEKQTPMALPGGTHLQGVLIEGEKNPVMLQEDGYPYLFLQGTVIF